MGRALSLLCVATLVLLAGLWWPRPGHPVVLLLPAQAAGGAFGVPGWQVLDIRSAGPLAFVMAAPLAADASPAALRRATSAWLIALAEPRPACSTPS